MLIDTTDEAVIGLGVTCPLFFFWFISEKPTDRQAAPRHAPHPTCVAATASPLPIAPPQPLLFLFSNGHETPAAFLNTARVLE